MGLLTTIAFIRRGIHSGLCSPDIADFRDLYFFLKSNYLLKLKLNLFYAHYCPFTGRSVPQVQYGGPQVPINVQKTHNTTT